jgi:hypothetical protein
MWTVVTLFRGRVVYATCHADKEEALTRAVEKAVREGMAEELARIDLENDGQVCRGDVTILFVLARRE